MVTLPRLDTYTAAELDAVAAQSPAFARYRLLLATGGLDDLRALRHRAWCECAAATLLARAPTARVCAYWSAVADEILTAAWDRCGLGSAAALLVAFGKLGAGELNLSSDVDLLIVAEPAAAAAALKGLRQFRALVGDGPDGFCFRLDFDLRPGGRNGPLITTPAQFQDHYWTQGEPWERLAMVRLRPIVGDPDLRARIEELTARFAYRRHLDYTLIEELRVLRAAVHARGFTRRPGEIDLKLEVGGIRDVELFTHLQQVIHGGRLEDLRVRATDEALRRLAAHGVIDMNTATRLERAYWSLRDFENRVQAVDDRQVHELPDGPRSDEVRALMGEVDGIVSQRLGVTATVTELPAAAEAQGAWLTDLGLAAESRDVVWPQLIAHSAHSRDPARDELARRNFLYAIVRAIARRPDADRGLATLTDFVRAARGKASLFTLLVRQPALIDDLARYVCTSPYLGAILAGRPELLDQLVRPTPVAWSSDPATLLDQLSERKLLTEIWAANQLSIGTPIAEICSRVSDVADQAASLLLAQLHAEYPASDVRVLALGKWGGRELGLRSDLDFVFVTEADPTADDLRVARRFITRLTDPSGYGALYDVDLRLRPSGQSGPLMVTFAKLRDYWATAAAPWERQAYLRARLIDGVFTREGLCARTIDEADATELSRIRRALLRDDGTLNVKAAPGGLIDIEFAAQTALLMNGIEDAPASTVGMIERLMTRVKGWRDVGVDLIAGYDEIRRIEQALQLTSARKVHEITNDDDAARAGAVLDLADLAARVRALLASNRRALNEVDPLGLRY